MSRRRPRRPHKRRDCWNYGKDMKKHKQRSTSNMTENAFWDWDEIFGLRILKQGCSVLLGLDSTSTKQKHFIRLEPSQQADKISFQWYLIISNNITKIQQSPHYMHPKTRRDVEESKIAECGTSDGAESSSNPIAQMVQEKPCLSTRLSVLLSSPDFAQLESKNVASESSDHFFWTDIVSVPPPSLPAAKSDLVKTFGPPRVSRTFKTQAGKAN